jgi:vacuolar-type H+-ATPase subunit H
MIEGRNILDQVNFQIRRKGYDVDEVRVFIENLHNKYVDETLRVDKLSRVIADMEKVIRDNLEEEYDEKRSLLDNILNIVLQYKKQKYQLEERQKRLSELEEKLESLDNVQAKVMNILASAQEFRSQAEEKADLIVRKAMEEANSIRETAKKDAENLCLEYTKKSKDIIEKTKSEIDKNSRKMKDILELYFSEIEAIAESVNSLKNAYQSLLEKELDKLKGEWEFESINNQINGIKDSISNLEELVDYTFDENSGEEVAVAEEIPIVEEQKQEPAEGLGPGDIGEVGTNEVNGMYGTNEIDENEDLKF